MADNNFSLHVDDDWKKQAQEEKRRLAEEQAKKAAAPAVAPSAMAGSAAAQASTSSSPQRGQREVPPASFSSLVQTVLTQILYQLGDLSHGEGPVNLDAAKHQIDTLGVLEEKTKGNLTEQEQKVLDTALYESRTRYIGIASQYINF
jgi:hypothetical protein